MTKSNGRFTWPDSISLREYLESRLRAMDEAVKVALVSMDKRLDSMNEFRTALKDQSSLFASSSDMEKVEADIRLLRESKAQLEGKASQQSVATAQLLGLAGVVLGVAGLLVSVFRG